MMKRLLIWTLLQPRSHSQPIGCPIGYEHLPEAVGQLDLRAAALIRAAIGEIG
jgi:hypothetical protein